MVSKASTQSVGAVAERSDSFHQVVLFDDEPRSANAVVSFVAGPADEAYRRTGRRRGLASLLELIPVCAPNKKDLRRFRMIAAVSACAAVFTPLVVAMVDPVMIFLGLSALIQNTLHAVADGIEISSLMALVFIILRISSPNYRRLCQLGLELEEMDECSQKMSMLAQSLNAECHKMK